MNNIHFNIRKQLVLDHRILACHTMLSQVMKIINREEKNISAAKKKAGKSKTPSSPVS